jgi:uncharacterized glyoxalase superfamily protein PhnB
MSTDVKAIAGQTIFPGLVYTDARAAVAWLERAFGAAIHVVYDHPDGSVAHAELVIAGNILMFGQSRKDNPDNPVRSPKEVNAMTAGIYVVLPDAGAVDAMYARAVAAGATIRKAPNDTDYGSHDFSTSDLEGTPWTFGTYAPRLGK